MLSAARLLTFALIIACRAGAQENREGLPAYLDGLDALEAGKFADAGAFMRKATDADGDNPHFVIARGVTFALQEKLKESEADLRRAQRLEPQNNEARLWLAAVIAMRGDFERDVMVFAFATRDPYENAVRSMSRDYGLAAFQRSTGVLQDENAAPEDKRDLANLSAEKLRSARAAFPRIAALFAQRAKTSTPGIAPLLLSRARQRVERKEYASAAADLRRFLAVSPDDADALFLMAGCNLHLESPAAARGQYTRVATAQPGNAQAYMGRALAALAMGDARRAQSDLDAAVRIAPSQADAFRKQVSSAIAQRPAPRIEKSSLPALVVNLQRKALAGAKDQELIDLANDLLRAVNAHRLRADETYLDRRRALQDAARGAPASASAFADLGEFLYREATMIRGETVEPRAPFQTYRPQTKESQNLELRQAHLALDQALKLDANNVKALTFKAACLMWNLQWGDAEALLHKAIAIDRTYPPLLEVFSQLLDHAAAVRSARAMNLRSVDSWSTFEYNYYRYPSQSELDAADQYDAQAQKLWRLAMEHLEAAARLHAGKPDGFYYSGVIARRNGDVPAARAAFEQCVKLAPDHGRALDQLAPIYAALQMHREAAHTRAAATNLSHTTAGPMLRHAWTQIVRTAWKASRDALQQAMLLDPADPRIAAYLAVIAQADNNADEALAWYRVAAALEECHRALNAESLRPAAATPLSPDAAALMLVLNRRAGELLAARNQHEAALTLFQNNLAIAQRIDADDLYRPIAASMLPDPESDPHTFPQANNTFTLRAWSHLGAGRALLALKRDEEALAQFRILRPASRQIPPTVDAGNRHQEPVAWATIALCNAMLAKNDVEGAYRELTRGERPWGESKEVQEALRTLDQRITELRSKLNQQDDLGLDPETRRRYDEFERRRVEEAQRQIRELEQRGQRRPQR